MSRSSARRGAIEPLAALAAVLAVTAGLALYAAVAAGPTAGPDRDRAGTALDRAWSAVAHAGVADPELLGRGRVAAPNGGRINLSLTADGQRWTAGPTPPADAATASRPASVRVAPGEVRPGRLRVVVWT